jgi:hypothetical protein
MPPYLHQTVSALPIIPFGAAGMVAGAYAAHRLGLWGGEGTVAFVLGAVAALCLMLGIGWLCSLPAQLAYDRLIAARCPQCGKNAAYRRWPSISRYRCRACGADSSA